MRSLAVRASRKSTTNHRDRGCDVTAASSPRARLRSLRSAADIDRAQVPGLVRIDSAGDQNLAVERQDLDVLQTARLPGRTDIVLAASGLDGLLLPLRMIGDGHHNSAGRSKADGRGPVT